MANKSGAKKPASKSATSKKTATKSTAAKSTAGKKRGRPSKQAKKQADINRAWSIVMFALGLVITAMSFVAGEKFWAYLRQNFLFGVFGFSSYFIGPVLLYIGVLTVSDKPVRLKMFWATGFILLLSNFVQIFFIGDVAGAGFAEKLVELHRLGVSETLSGGVIAALIALPMQAALGATECKITITVLTITFFMFLTDTTPYDIYIKMRDKAEREKEALARQMEASRQAKAEKQRLKQRQREEAERQRLEAERERQILEATKPKLTTRKIDFDIDDEPSVDVLEEFPDFAEVDVQQAVEETFDRVKEQKSIEQQKIDEIMKKLNLSHKTEEEKEISADDAAIKAEKAKNTLTPQEKAAIVPVSEIAPELAPDDKAYIYIHPPIDLFQKGGATNRGDVENELKTNAKKLVDTLESFGVQTRIIDISRGPAVTRYELQPLAGVKISKITNLADDIALNLAASGVRIEAPIPNKAAVGIEVPNKQGSSVNIRTIFENPQFRNAASPLTIALGMDIAGNVVTTDLTRMPHLLIAGSTGSGKSVCINAIITSFLYKSSPEDVKLILIDPKVVELAEYNGIPHLMMPVVTEPKKAAGALGGAVAEMEKRYRLFAENSVRDIKSFNKLVAAQPELALEKMPYIAVVIDELADLMMVSGKEVEDYICRLAQKARAAGIHLIVATQRPSVDVITGLIKANIPARIAFAVSSQVDSRTILDAGGAEKLLGMGDMLFLPLGASKPIRVQGTYVKDEEISSVIEFIKRDFVAEYNQEMIENMEKLATKDKGSASSNDDGGETKDEMLPKAIEVVVEAGQASTSLLQRRLKLGYARAARIMDEMEAMGIIGPYEGSKPRQVLITKNQWLEMTLGQGE